MSLEGVLATLFHEKGIRPSLRFFATGSIRVKVSRRGWSAERTVKTLNDARLWFIGKLEAANAE